MSDAGTPKRDVGKWAAASMAVLPAEGAWFEALLATAGPRPETTAESDPPPSKRRVFPRRATPPAGSADVAEADVSAP